MTMKIAFLRTTLLLSVAVAVASFAATAHAAAPGIAGSTFNLIAQPAFLNQPDGSTVYAWGYGCATSPASSAFVPRMPNQNCPPCRFPAQP